MNIVQSRTLKNVRIQMAKLCLGNIKHNNNLSQINKSSCIVSKCKIF